MAATRESIKGNGASIQGALFRDRCWRSWWKKGQHRATCTTFLEGQFWKSSKTMVMTWLTQSSLAEFRSVFGNSFNIDSLCLSVSLRSNRHKKVCLFLLFYFFLLNVLISFVIWVFCNNNSNVLVFFLKKKKLFGVFE